MEVKAVNDDLVIDTIRALWRKRDTKGALALVVRIPDPVLRKIWEATILIAKAELLGELSAESLDDDWFLGIDTEVLVKDIQIDIQLVKGRIALLQGLFAQAEDYFFGALLSSRDVDYLLGKVQSMVGLGEVKRMNNHFEQAYDLAVTAASLAEKLPDKNRKYVENEVLLLQCQVHLSVQDYDKLAPKAEELLALSKACGETLKYVQAKNYMAVVHGSKGDYKKAMPYFLEALDVCKKIEFHSLAIKIATNIATIHGQLNNYDEALARYHSILDEYKAPIRPEKTAVILNNIGNLYVRLGKWKDAISYFLDAEKIADEKDYMPLKRLAFCQIARCLIETESNDAFLTHMRSEEHLFDRSYANGLQILHYVKAKYALSQKQYKEAIRYGIQAVEVADTFNDDTTKLQTQNLLAQAYEANGDLSAALEIYKEYARKKEKLDNERARNMIINTEIDYILAAKEKEIHTLQRENQLQAELIKSTSLIRKKNKELVAKNEELSYFARMISVDFNKHLRVVSQFVGLLDVEGNQDNRAKNKEYLVYIHDAVAKVSSLVDGLYKYAMVIDDYQVGSPVKVSELLQIIQYDLEDLLTQKNVKIRYSDDLPVLECGKAQLLKVFKELIENSIHFCREKGAVIEITAQELEGELVIHFADNGIGIPEGDERKIFWAFYRTGQKTEAEGNGLGLAASKKIIEKYNGRIKAANSEKGLVVSVFLPQKCHQVDA